MCHPHPSCRCCWCSHGQPVTQCTSVSEREMKLECAWLCGCHCGEKQSTVLQGEMCMAHMYTTFRRGEMPRIDIQKSKIQMHSNYRLSGRLEKYFTKWCFFVKVPAKDHREPSSIWESLQMLWFRNTFLSKMSYIYIYTHIYLTHTHINLYTFIKLVLHQKNDRGKNATWIVKYN